MFQEGVTAAGSSQETRETNHDESLAVMVSMGFDAIKAQEALKVNNWSSDEAIDYLVSRKARDRTGKTEDDDKTAKRVSVKKKPFVAPPSPPHDMLEEMKRGHVVAESQATSHQVFPQPAASSAGQATATMPGAEAIPGIFDASREEETTLAASQQNSSAGRPRDDDVLIHAHLVSQRTEPELVVATPAGTGDADNSGDMRNMMRRMYCFGLIIIVVVIIAVVLVVVLSSRSSTADQGAVPSPTQAQPITPNPTTPPQSGPTPPPMPPPTPLPITPPPVPELTPPPTPPPITPPPVPSPTPPPLTNYETEFYWEEDFGHVMSGPDVSCDECYLQACDMYCNDSNCGTSSAQGWAENTMEAWISDNEGGRIATCSGVNYQAISDTRCTNTNCDTGVTCEVECDTPICRWGLECN